MLRPVAILFAFALVCSAEHTGTVRFGGLPVPGATVTAVGGERKLSTITNAQGHYSFADIPDGSWSVRVEMQLFSPLERSIQLPDGGVRAEWDLTASPPPISSAIPSKTPYVRAELTAVTEPPETERPKTTKAETLTAEAQTAADLAFRAADGFLINGSVNNGAASPFAQLPAFGNNRRGRGSLYNGSLGLILNSALFDARSFSLTGQATRKPNYQRTQALLAFGGPIRVPGLMERNGPIVSLNYQWTRNSNAATQSGLVPTAAERSGDFSATTAPILDPATRMPFPGNQIPQSRLSSPAQALLELYPRPNFSGSSHYNYQVPVVSGLHQDEGQSRISKQVGRHFVFGNLSWQSTRTDTPHLFGFVDTGSITGLNTGLTYRRTFSPRAFLSFAYQLSRLDTRVNPYFSGRRNVSGEAGISGNNQEPGNWGPPNLVFGDGITSLVHPQASRTRDQTGGISIDGFLSRGRHYTTYGVSHRRQQWNILSQQDARGTLAFTGALTGISLAGLLLGIPDTSSIAFGNADKYLRGTVNEAFLNNDWRVNPGLTINAGVRWEYWSPAVEKYGRLVNLEITPGFTSVSAVVAHDNGSAAFPRPDRNNIAPRLAFSWRPVSDSSTVIRGGYGVYFDTSVYQPIAIQMAQQAPLSKSLRVANDAESPFTLANPFSGTSSASPATTFAVDPAFRVGYSQNWQISVQRDLPGALQVNANYSGGKGTRAQQQFLPNTYPESLGAGELVHPSGFTYLASNGNSIRHSGQANLRRRLRSGLTGSLQYTWSKSIDNAILGGRGSQAGQTWTAQNWLDLSAERALSSFDQRHVLAAMVQYTTGMGMRGLGSGLSGWPSALLKEWTISSQINAGSGLRLTPVYFAPVRGTGLTGSLRPDYTGAPLYLAPEGLFLNPSAFAAPDTAKWGNAGRNSITGPGQFVLNASLGRTFRSSERFSWDLRIDATNALNQVNFTSWNTVLGSAQFGVPNAVSPMRTAQVVVRSRF